MKGGKGRKVGQQKEKCAAYKNAKTSERNKVKRILQSNGVSAATKYAEKNQVHATLNTLLHYRNNSRHGEHGRKLSERFV